MSARMSCYPFGLTIKCTCDNRGRPLQCVPVLDYSVGLNVGAGGGVGGGHGGAGHLAGHDIWGDDVLNVNDDGMGLMKEQETEVILAFTLLVTILLTFIGFLIHRCERLSFKKKCQTCPEFQTISVVSQTSVCVQTDQEQGLEDPFPLLTHLNRFEQLDESNTMNTSPPTTKTSYTSTVATGQSLPHIYPHLSTQEQDAAPVDHFHFKASQYHLEEQLEN